MVRLNGLWSDMEVNGPWSDIQVHLSCAGRGGPGRGGRLGVSHLFQRRLLLGQPLPPRRAVKE